MKKPKIKALTQGTQTGFTLGILLVWGDRAWLDFSPRINEGPGVGISIISILYTTYDTE